MGLHDNESPGPFTVFPSCGEDFAQQAMDAPWIPMSEEEDQRPVASEPLQERSFDDQEPVQAVKEAVLVDECPEGAVPVEAPVAFEDLTSEFTEIEETVCSTAFFWMSFCFVFCVGSKG
ncbi:unnamed protein product [Durusdinium trenchii]|uniref:Uncharacterized protein n=1 Tax=Durusdinium trenchii TaxID=1381693 RepID=A0ABP0NN05_9DINO